MTTSKNTTTKGKAQNKSLRMAKAIGHRWSSENSEMVIPDIHPHLAPHYSLILVCFTFTSGAVTKKLKKLKERYLFI